MQFWEWKKMGRKESSLNLSPLHPQTSLFYARNRNCDEKWYCGFETLFGLQTKKNEVNLVIFFLPYSEEGHMVEISLLISISRAYFLILFIKKWILQLRVDPAAGLFFKWKCYLFIILIQF